MAHKTLNAVKQDTTDIKKDTTEIKENLQNLPQVVVDAVMDVMTGNVDIAALEGKSEVEKRNFFLNAARNNQSIANVHSAAEADRKHEQKLLRTKPEDIAALKAAHAEMTQVKEASFMRMQATKKATADKKVAAKQAAAEKVAAKKTAAAEKVAAKAAKAAAKEKAAGGRKRKTSADPEVAAIEAQTDADIASIEAGNFAQSSDANDLTHCHRIMALFPAETANVCLAPPEQSDEPLPPTEPHAETANVCLAAPEQSDEPLDPMLHELDRLIGLVQSGATTQYGYDETYWERATHIFEKLMKDGYTEKVEALFRSRKMTMARMRMSFK